MYWKEKTPGVFGADRFPCLRFVKQIEHEGKHNIYCVPSGEYPGMFKVSLRCKDHHQDRNQGRIGELVYMCIYIILSKHTYVYVYTYYVSSHTERNDGPSEI